MVEDHAVLLKSVKKSTLAHLIAHKLCTCGILLIFFSHSKEKWWRQIQFRRRKRPKYDQEGNA